MLPQEIGSASLEPERMMFVGDKGKIIAGFRSENPKLLSDTKSDSYRMKSYIGGKEVYKEQIDSPESHWINAFKNKTQSSDSFLYAGPVTETILLGAVALGARRKWSLNQPV